MNTEHIVQEATVTFEVAEIEHEDHPERYKARVEGGMMWSYGDTVRSALRHAAGAAINTEIEGAIGDSWDGDVR